MEHSGKKSNPFKGLLLSAIILIVVPILLFLIIYGVALKFYPVDYCFKLGTAFGLLAGFCFHMVLVFAGVFKGTLKAVINRIGNFFSNIKISFSFACKYYWEDIKEHGINFWVYLIIIIANIIVCLLGWYGLYIEHIDYFR